MLFSLCGQTVQVTYKSKSICSLFPHPMSHYFKYHKFVWYFYKTISLQETPQLQRFRVRIVHLKFHREQ